MFAAATVNGQPSATSEAPVPGDVLRLAHEQLAAQQAQLDETGAAFVRVTGQLSVAQAHVERLEQEARDRKAELVRMHSDLCGAQESGQDARREAELLRTERNDAVDQAKRQGEQLQGLIQTGRADAAELGRLRELSAFRHDEIHRLEGCWALTIQELADAKKVLTIEGISRVNLARSQRWHPGGIEDWSLSDWYAATGGEAGELGNAYLALACVSSFAHLGDTVKKLNRVRDGLVGNSKSADELRQDLADEIADAYLYLDHLAQRAGINLGTAIVNKFNKTSERVGFPERLGEEVSQS